MPATSEDYFSDGDSTPAAAPKSKADDQDSEGPVAVLRKEIFGGEVNPGDQITLKVDKVDEGNVLCSKMEENPEEDEQPPAEAPETSGGGGGEMSSMLED